MGWLHIADIKLQSVFKYYAAIIQASTTTTTTATATLKTQLHRGHDLVWRAATYICLFVFVASTTTHSNILSRPEKNKRKQTKNCKECESTPGTTLLSGQQLVCCWEAY